MMAMIIMIMITIKARWWFISFSSRRRQSSRSASAGVRWEHCRSPILPAAARHRDPPAPASADAGGSSFLYVQLKGRGPLSSVPRALSVLPREAEDRAGERLGWTPFIATPAASLPTAVGQYKHLAAGGTRLLSPVPAAAKKGRTVPASRQPSGAGAGTGTGPAGAPSIMTSGLRQPRSGSALPLFTRGDASRWLAGSPVGSSREVPQPRVCHKRWRGDKLAPAPGVGSPERGAAAAAPFVQGKDPGAGSPAPFGLTGTTFSGSSGRPCTGSRHLDSPREAAELHRLARRVSCPAIPGILVPRLP